jgi:hypothetical protein
VTECGADVFMVRCMEHSVSVGAGHFIRKVSPASSRSVLRKVRQAFKNAGGNEDKLDLDQLDSDLSEIRDLDDEDTQADNEDDADEFDAGDSVGKALALVKQVSFPLATTRYWTNSHKIDSKISSGSGVLPLNMQRSERSRVRAHVVDPHSVGLPIPLPRQDASPPKGVSILLRILLTLINLFQYRALIGSLAS